MTKKHFKAIADAIADAIAGMPKKGNSRKDIAEVIASVCAQFNGMFDRERFLNACDAVYEEKAETQVSKRPIHGRSFDD